MAENENNGVVCDIDEATLKTIVKNIRNAKERACEHTGEAGSLTKTACEQHNIPKAVLTGLTKLAKMDPTQAEAHIAANLSLWHMYGLFDHVDIFIGEQMIETLEAILERLKQGKHNGPDGGGPQDDGTLSGLAA